MLETSARLLRVLGLLQARRYWPGAELAQRLEVTPRTLRRDINRLRDLGYTVHASSGSAGGYQLGRGSTLPPLLLEDEEALAVGISLRTACASGINGIEAAGLTALAKFEHVLPSRLQRRMNALESSVSPMTEWRTAVDANAISTIATACHDRECLRFTYSTKDKAEQARRVEPHQLVHTGTRWYLVAWDLERDDWRTFRVDRIQAPRSTGLRFNARKPPEEGYTAYVWRSVAYQPYTHRARVILHCSQQAATERIPAGAGVLQPLSEDTCLLSTGANSLDMLSIYLTMTGVDFAVIEPPELIEHLRIVQARFTRALKLSRKRS